jgi:type IV pilus assembly protein PilB
MEKKRLGDILIDCNLITKDQLMQALSFQKEKGIKLGQALIDLELVTEDDIIWALGNQLNISFIHLNPQIVDSAVLKLISPEYAKEHRLIPLYKSGTQLSICMVDPLEVEAIDDIAGRTQCEVSVSICTKFDFEQTYAAVYGPLEIPSKVSSEITSEKHPALEKGIPKGMEGPEKVINYILGQAIIAKVDKIHFEPTEKGVLIRFRTCSSLIRKLEIPFKLHQEILVKLKSLSQIAGAQSQIQPHTVQVGHFRVTVSGRTINIQSLFYPTVNGEMVILKLGYFSENAAEVLGKSKLLLDEVAKVLHTQHGVLYITGPRESGRSVTAYYLLSAYDFEKTKIVTVEDPVQTNFPRLTQIQVGQAGVGSLNEGFHLALQLDPDVVFIDCAVGLPNFEDLGFAGLGGRTILSTFTAHDAVSSLVKVLSQVEDPLITANSLCGVLSQRLIRVLCPECREACDATAEELSRLHLTEEKKTLYKAKGCDKCQNSGYVGKNLIAEFIPVSSVLKQMMNNRQKYQEIYHFARKLGIPSLEESAIKMVIDGETSYDELQRLF